MEKDKLIQQIEIGLSTWKLADYFKTTQPNIRYWLKKYELQTNRTSNIISGKKLCPRCKDDKDKSEFYQYKKSSSFCKKCILESNTERRLQTKQKAVDYLGGKCTSCGYNKCLAALEFHHINPKDKDKDYFNYRGGFTDTLKTELDKCVLLCANCHREKHHLL